MTYEGRMARGKENYEAGKFLENSETVEYAATLKVETPKAKPKEAKDAKSNE